MCPARVAEYVQQHFGGPQSAVKVRVEADPERIRQEYPLLAAVSRCANSVEGHKVTIICYFILIN